MTKKEVKKIRKDIEKAFLKLEKTKEDLDKAFDMFDIVLGEIETRLEEL